MSYPATPFRFPSLFRLAFRTTHKAHKGQRGIALTELIVALMIVSVLAVYATARIQRDSEEAIAKGGAVYLETVAGALQQHAMLNFNELANNMDVTSTVADLTPTIAEMITAGRLNAGYPTSMPTRQSVSLTIARQNCPGPNCLLTGLVCTTTPITLGGTATRFDLASTMMAEQNGIGGQSLPGAGATIRGPNINTPNPMGNVEGIVCGSAAVDTAMWQQFVRIGDTRDPNLQGPLTVAGPTTFAGTTTIGGPTTINNSATITGTLTAGNINAGNCVRINGATGVSTFGCGPTTTVSGAGVSGAGLTSTGAITAGTGITSTGGNIVATAGAVAGQTIRADGTYVAGGPCVSGSFGQSASGMLVCVGGSWRDLVRSAAAGDACSIEGVTATTTTGVQLACIGGVYVSYNNLFPAATTNAACLLAGKFGYDAQQRVHICRANPADASATLRWMRLQDLVGNLAFVQSLEVTHDQKLVKPTCGGPGALPVIQMIAKVESSSDAGFARYAINIVEAGIAKWQVKLENGAGGTLTSTTGSAVAVAQIYCYTP